MDPLGTDSCRGTVPMEPPMSNRSMHHQNPDLDFDDTGHFLQGALCIIAAHVHRWCRRYPGLEMCSRDVPRAHHCEDCIQAAALASSRRLSLNLRLVLALPYPSRILA
jgi:hypothetical protein